VAILTLTFVGMVSGIRATVATDGRATDGLCWYCYRATGPA